MKHKTPVNGTSIATTPRKRPSIPQGGLVIPDAKFSLGRVVMTPAALQALTPIDVVNALSRHVTGDWGDVCPEDREKNELSLRERLTVLSIYHTKSGTKYWVLTEFEIAVTTVLLPEDY